LGLGLPRFLTGAARMGRVALHASLRVVHPLTAAHGSDPTFPI